MDEWIDGIYEQKMRKALQEKSFSKGAAKPDNLNFIRTHMVESGN